MGWRVGGLNLIAGSYLGGQRNLQLIMVVNTTRPVTSPPLLLAHLAEFGPVDGLIQHLSGGNKLSLFKKGPGW